MDTEMTRYESFAEVTEDFYCSAVDVLKMEDKIKRLLREEVRKM